MPFKSIAVATLVAIAAAALPTPAGASVVSDWNAAALAEVRLARLGPRSWRARWPTRTPACTTPGRPGARQAHDESMHCW